MLFVWLLILLLARQRKNSSLCSKGDVLLASGAPRCVSRIDSVISWLIPSSIIRFSNRMKGLFNLLYLKFSLNMSLSIYICHISQYMYFGFWWGRHSESAFVVTVMRRRTYVWVPFVKTRPIPRLPWDGWDVGSGRTGAGPASWISVEHWLSGESWATHWRDFKSKCNVSVYRLHVLCNGKIT